MGYILLAFQRELQFVLTHRATTLSPTVRASGPLSLRCFLDIFAGPLHLDPALHLKPNKRQQRSVRRQLKFSLAKYDLNPFFFSLLFVAHSFCLHGFFLLPSLDSHAKTAWCSRSTSLIGAPSQGLMALLWKCEPMNV
jgi:hypothetical protein